LEAVAVAGEVRDAPPVVAVAVGDAALDGDRRGEAPRVEAVVDVVPQPGPAHDVAGAAALLDAQAVGALTVLARVPVVVAVEVDDLVVGRAALQLEPGLVVVVR